MWCALSRVRDSRFSAQVGEVSYNLIDSSLAPEYLPTEYRSAIHKVILGRVPYEVVEFAPSDLRTEQRVSRWYDPGTRPICT